MTLAELEVERKYCGGCGQRMRAIYRDVTDGYNPKTGEAIRPRQKTLWVCATVSLEDIIDDFVDEGHDVYEVTP